MIHYTPIEKTVVGQELIRMGRIEGRTEGRIEGKIIGRIHATQRFLNRRVTPEKKLLSQSIKELKATLKPI